MGLSRNQPGVKWRYKNEVTIRMRSLNISELREFQLNILAEIDEFCEQSSMTYYLCAGTLLGAVRHHGYIPWDDDVDIMIPRPDYERFCKTFSRHADQDRFRLYSLATSNRYPLPFAKVCDQSTLIDVESDIVRDIGVYVDVFPIDGWCRGELLQRIQRGLISILSNMIRVKHLQRNSARKRLNEFILTVGKVILSPVPARSIARGISKVCQLGSFDQCDNAGVLVWGYHESVPREAYGAPAEVAFNGRNYPGPADPDAVLTTLYGDYMTLPKESERVTNHRFTAYSLS